jgi:hypothetical protein
VAPRVPNCPPDSFVAGDTVQWTVADRDVSDFPPGDGWTLTARLLGASTLAVDADVVGGRYQVTFAAADTKQLDAGAYQVVLSARLGTARYTVGNAHRVAVTPDPAATKPGEALSFAERMLVQARALYVQVSADSLAEYTYADRHARRWTLAEVNAEIAKWQQACWRERNPGQFAPRVMTTFTRPR